MSRAALYSGIGRGLETLGQQMVFQQAETARQRREDSLLRLKRDWRQQDFDRQEAQRARERGEDREFWREQFAAQTDARAGEREADYDFRRGLLDQQQGFQAMLADQRASLERELTELRLQNDPQTQIAQRQFDMLERRLMSELAGQADQIARESASMVHWDSDRWRDDLNRIDPALLKGYSGSMDRDETRRLISQNARKLIHQQHSPLFQVHGDRFEQLMIGEGAADQEATDDRSYRGLEFGEVPMAGGLLDDMAINLGRGARALVSPIWSEQHPVGGFAHDRGPGIARGLVAGWRGHQVNVESEVNAAIEAVNRGARPRDVARMMRDRGVPQETIDQFLMEHDPASARFDRR